MLATSRQLDGQIRRALNLRYEQELLSYIRLLIDRRLSLYTQLRGTNQPEDYASRGVVNGM
jgi:hypothetical protein